MGEMERRRVSKSLPEVHVPSNVLIQPGNLHEPAHGFMWRGLASGRGRREAWMGWGRKRYCLAVMMVRGAGDGDERRKDVLLPVRVVVVSRGLSRGVGFLFR